MNTDNISPDNEPFEALSEKQIAHSQEMERTGIINCPSCGHTGSFQEGPSHKFTAKAVKGYLPLLGPSELNVRWLICSCKEKFLVRQELLDKALANKTVIFL